MCKLNKGGAIHEFNFLSEVLPCMSPESYRHSKKVQKHGTTWWRTSSPSFKVQIVSDQLPATNQIHHAKWSAKLGIHLTQLALDHHFSRFSSLALKRINLNDKPMSVLLEILCTIKILKGISKQNRKHDSCNIKPSEK